MRFMKSKRDITEGEEREREERGERENEGGRDMEGEVGGGERKDI